MRGGLGQLWSQPREENLKYLFSAQVVTSILILIHIRIPGQKRFYMRLVGLLLLMRLNEHG